MDEILNNLEAISNLLCENKKISIDDFTPISKLIAKTQNQVIRLCEVSISATEKAQLISSLSQLLIDNKSAGLYKQLQTDCVNKLELLVNSIEL